MMRWFTADLHVHTCLSPCADVTMSPRRIVAEAARRGLDIVAITDHNSAENVPAALRAARGTAVAVLPGMEVCSSEEVHVLALFETLDAVLQLQEDVYRKLQGSNIPAAFGFQVIANEHDEVEGFQDRMLSGAADITLDEIVRRIHELRGLAIASHIDREAFGMLGQLGFIPHGLPLDALELSGGVAAERAERLAREYPAYRFIRNSDAHGLDRVGAAWTRFFLDAPTCEEIRKALRHTGGRDVAPASRD
jgi:hypothetical protein